MNSLLSPIFRLAKHRVLPFTPLTVINGPIDTRQTAAMPRKGPGEQTPEMKRYLQDSNQLSA